METETLFEYVDHDGEVITLDLTDGLFELHHVLDGEIPGHRVMIPLSHNAAWVLCRQLEAYFRVNDKAARNGVADSKTQPQGLIQ